MYSIESVSDRFCVAVVANRRKGPFLRGETMEGGAFSYAGAICLLVSAFCNPLIDSM
jgi:hypothetical protein